MTKETDITRYYNNNAIDYCKRTLKIDLQSIYPEFLQHLKINNKILDAGCGSGRDSKFFQQLSYDITAMDASKELVLLSSKLIGKPTLHLSFDEMTFENEFDGIWACASLLHVSNVQMNTILEKFVHALKTNGIWFMSFKYGTEELFYNGILYNYQNEMTLSRYIANFHNLKTIKMWKHHSCDSSNSQVDWLCCIVQKI